MAPFAVVTKIIFGFPTDEADTVAGSLAKKISDYIETVTNTKTIRSITSSKVQGNQVMITIIHDS